MSNEEREYLEDVEGRLSELLVELTGGKLSKTNYPVHVMVQEIEQRFMDIADKPSISPEQIGQAAKALADWDGATGWDTPEWEGTVSESAYRNGALMAFIGAGFIVEGGE